MTDIEKIKHLMTNSDRTWRGTPQELMECLETEELIPPYDDRRGFDVDGFLGNYNRYPITQDHLFYWAIIGKSRILQIEELARQYMLEITRITGFKFQEDNVAWTLLHMKPFGFSYWSRMKGVKLGADGAIYAGGNKYATCASDIYAFGYGIWNVDESCVAVAYSAYEEEI